MIKPSTFSIVGYDPDAREWGAAVASKFLAAGALVIHARAEVGAVATQSFVNVLYGPEGLRLMEEGMIDANGHAATFTGDECMDWAGGTAGEGFACQGNILAGPDVVEAMAEAFQNTEGTLARRLLAALQAGDNAGGDRRGKQSAALLVVREDGGYGGNNDRYLDLRVDDHVEPATELGRLLELHELYFPPTSDSESVDYTPALLEEIQAGLQQLGYWSGPVDGESSRWRVECCTREGDVLVGRHGEPGGTVQRRRARRQGAGIPTPPGG